MLVYWLLIYYTRFLVTGYRGRVSFPFGSAQLTLKQITFEDGGLYICEILLTNGIKSLGSTTLKVYGKLFTSTYFVSELGLMVLLSWLYLCLISMISLSNDFKCVV